jgi:hypothetical protein
LLQYKVLHMIITFSRIQFVTVQSITHDNYILQKFNLLQYKVLHMIITFNIIPFDTVQSITHDNYILQRFHLKHPVTSLSL